MMTKTSTSSLTFLALLASFFPHVMGTTYTRAERLDIYAVAAVIACSIIVGVGMFMLLTVIVSIKRGNACSEHGPCANCCGEQQGFCCADIDKSGTIDPIFKCCSPTEGLYGIETYGCVGSQCMPAGGFFGQKDAGYCEGGYCADCYVGGECCSKPGLQAAPVYSANQSQMPMAPVVMMNPSPAVQMSQPMPMGGAGIPYYAPNVPV